MASTPSASALSAVLRCRRPVWTRTPPAQRPVTPADRAERSRSHQAPTGEAFLQGQRVVVGRRLSVAYNWSWVDVKLLREKGSREKNKLYYLKLSGAHVPSARGVQTAPVRNKLICNLPATETCSHLTRLITCEKYAAYICKIVLVQETSEFPTGILKVSITSSCLMDTSGQIPCFVLTGWFTLRSSCLRLTAALVSVLWRISSPDGASQHLLHQQHDKHVTNDALLQANGQIHSPTDLKSSKDSAQKITEDRPD